MILNRFTLYITVRVLLIFSVCLLLGFIYGNDTLFFNQVLLWILLLLMLSELIYFVNRTNMELSRLIDIVTYSDFSASLNSGKLGYSFRNLQKSFSDIAEKFERMKVEKEASGQFYQYILEQLPLGIIALNRNEVELCNAAARELLKLEENFALEHMSARFPWIYRLLEEGSEGSSLLDIETPGGKTTLLVEIGQLKKLEGKTTVLIIKDIGAEVDERELQAWLKLIRILTHEIMNSATPVSSLSESVEDMLTSEGRPVKAAEIQDHHIEDILSGIQTIRKRSDSMLEFAENYRKLTRVPRPDKTPVNIEQLTEEVLKLFQAEFHQHRISINCSIQPAVIDMDAGLIEQVLINLLSNSLHALRDTDQPGLEITGNIRGTTYELSVSDNGKGFDEGVLEKIFIPFYSTREDGSGIGLSLSRQIMYAHSGSLRARPGKEGGAVFILRFTGSVNETSEAL